MRRPFAFPIASLLALSACATAHVEDLAAADGTSEHRITCDESSECYAKAARVCRHGYDVRESNGDTTNSTTNYVSHGRVASTTSDATDVTIVCNDSQPPQAGVAAAGTLPPREDTRVCDAAYPFAGGFAQFWAARSPNATPLHDLPEHRDFVVTCQTLAEPIQRCMHDKFRQAHAEACDAVLARLGDRDKAKIDGLFLAAPDAAKAAPAPTTGDAPGAGRSL